MGVFGIRIQWYAAYPILAKAYTFGVAWIQSKEFPFQADVVGTKLTRAEAKYEPDQDLSHGGGIVCGRFGICLTIARGGDRIFFRGGQLYFGE